MSVVEAGDRPARRPGLGRVTPTSTYRVQLTPDFGFDDVAGLADYFAALGVSHVYLSPILAPAAGSTHGYDVISHARLNPECGGETAFARMVQALHARGVRLIADVVPNHMTIPTPAWPNAQLWSLLQGGQDSPTARWFDVDWQAQGDRVLLPVLGGPLAEVMDELSVGEGGPDGHSSVLKYYDHEFPLRPGTAQLPLPELLEAQAYRLADWRESGALNYRRFFDVTTLIAVRVEDLAVFWRTHAVLLDLIDSGALDGLRIDHPDGLADPGGYLCDLAAASGRAWVVAEKILEGAEKLPDWACAGTTGYDALQRVGGLFIDPSGEASLTALYAEFTGERDDIHAIIDRSKMDVVDTVLIAEIGRLVQVVATIHPDLDPESTERALRAFLVSMDRYRAYVQPGEPADDEAAAVLTSAAERAHALVQTEDLPALDRLLALALGTDLTVSPASGSERRAAADAARADFVVRFGQTCGPVMAKGIEDTAFYRYFRLTGLNEVGGDPGIFGVSPQEFHDYCADRLAHWPLTMTTLSTHDTKRTEDTRAALNVLSQQPEHWREWLGEARAAAATYRCDDLDNATEYLLWQTAVATWPITPERLRGYATKAIREAKTHTNWTAPNEAYEAAVMSFVDGILGDQAIAHLIARWQDESAAAYRCSVLGQKLLQLTMPGVPDVYQGCELTARWLVDPDNRRPVDFADRIARLASIEGAETLDEEKLRVTATALRLRRERPQWFVGPQATYRPLPSSADAVVAFGRGDDDGIGVVTVVRRWPDDAVARVDLPAGRWRDLLTNREFDLSADEGIDVLAEHPVALLEVI